MLFFKALWFFIFLLLTMSMLRTSMKNLFCIGTIVLVVGKIWWFLMSMFAVHRGISLCWMWTVMLSSYLRYQDFYFPFISSCNSFFQILCSSIYNRKASIVQSKKILSIHFFFLSYWIKHASKFCSKFK